MSGPPFSFIPPPREIPETPVPQPKKRGRKPKAEVLNLEEPTRLEDYKWAREQYEQSVLNVDQIARNIGVNVIVLQRRLYNEGWTRDSDRRARRHAEALANEQQAKTLATEKIERVNALMQSTALIRHREDIALARRIVMGLFREIEQQMDSMPELEEIGEILYSPDEQGKDRLNEAYRKTISLSGRVDNARKLGESLKTLILLERQAFGIVGALEEPDKPANAAEQIAQGFVSVMDKFATILGQKDETGTPTAKFMGEVVENDLAPAPVHATT